MEKLRGILRQVWGFDSFRPLQEEAIASVLEGRDSVVVLPTGGGKSLCYQAPALAMDGLAVVVSPLISLMKDQVDALTDNGVPAACVNSTLSVEERLKVAGEVRSGRLKLLYLSPERLMTERTLQFLQDIPLSFFAIDEAHCISDWGHDFRPEYRMLSRLKELFPNVAVHAYTATATEVVRQDIARELRLKEAKILVGSFDRPNLMYRVIRRGDLLAQIRDVIDRHPDESGIIYCIRRVDTEGLAANLTELGISALPYHAGMSDEDRRRNQEEFQSDKVKVIVATVAFGMGIDKSDVRYVIHAGAPKSLESYQQESGRAGRDGLEAECCLFHSGADFMTWRRLQSNLAPEPYRVAMQVLGGMEAYVSAAQCRHRALVEYFGQLLESENCGACDVCLGEIDLVADAIIISQKIMSCVLRLNQAFGGGYTADVLTGSGEQRIVENGHEKLSTWGLLADHDKKSVRAWIDQLVAQGFLEKVGEYGTLAVTPEGRRLLKGEGDVKLLKPAPSRAKRETKVAAASWDGVDRGLFEHLRALRRAKADARGLPPFVIFGDATLRDLARRRPSSHAALLRIHGIGAKKAADYGADFLEAIVEYCRNNGLTMDAAGLAREETEERSISGAKGRAFALFAEGKSLAEVSAAVQRAPSTTFDYLMHFIVIQGIADPSHWLNKDTFARIRASAKKIGGERLKPIFNDLGESVSYDEIKIALACIRNEPPKSN